MAYRVLQFANGGVINNQLKGLPSTRKVFEGFDMFMSGITKGTFVSKVRDSLDRNLYGAYGGPSAGVITQPSTGYFLSTEWITEVWSLLQNARLTEATLKPFLGYHLVPIEGGLLAPLDEKQPIIHRSGLLTGSADSSQVLSLLSAHFGCYVVRSNFFDYFSWWGQCFVSITNVAVILTLLADKSDDMFESLNQTQRRLLCDFVSATLSSQETVRGSQRQTLERLPIYQGYVSSELVSLQDLGGVMTLMLCQGFSSEDHPWELSAITLLKQDQPMSDHLCHVLKIRTIRDSEYWYQFFSERTKANSVGKDDWNSFMKVFLPSFYRHSHERNFEALLRDVPFVDVERNDENHAPSIKLSPTMAVSRDLSQFFFQDESVFPAGMYGGSDKLTVLTKLGMTTHFDVEFAKNRLQQIAAISTDSLNSQPITLRVISNFFARLNIEIDTNYMQDRSFVQLVENLAWVPARAQDNGSLCLYKPGQCRPLIGSLITGNHVPTSSLICTNKDLLSLLSWSRPPPLRAVLANLLDIATQTLQGRRPSNFEESIQAIYRDLNCRTQDPQAVFIMKEMLGSSHCVLIERKFHAIDRVAIKIRKDCHLEPHFIQVPDSEFIQLFRALGVREEVTSRDMEGILATIHSSYEDGFSLSENDTELVVRILQTISHAPKASEYSPDLLVLTEDSQLRKLSEVVYNDMANSTTGTQDYGSGHVFCNNRISKQVAMKLHIQMLSEKVWGGCNDDFFQNWEQQISVVDSINKILNDYGPDTIFTEYLQNAADAGATQFSIMLDHQSYSSKGILNEKMSEGQGPALLVWNNAEFTQQDFEGLRKMAMGSKRKFFHFQVLPACRPPLLLSCQAR